MDEQRHKKVDRIAWGVLYFALGVGAALLLLGVAALVKLVF